MPTGVFAGVVALLARAALEADVNRALAGLALAVGFAGAAHAELVAEQITPATAAQRSIGGPDAIGGVGDWWLANDVVEVVIDDVARAFGISTHGGTVVDFGLRDRTGEDQFARLSPLVNLSQRVVVGYDAIRAEVDPQRRVRAHRRHESGPARAAARVALGARARSARARSAGGVRGARRDRVRGAARRAVRAHRDGAHEHGIGARARVRVRRRLDARRAGRPRVHGRFAGAGARARVRRARHDVQHPALARCAHELHPRGADRQRRISRRSRMRSMRPSARRAGCRSTGSRESTRRSRSGWSAIRRSPSSDSPRSRARCFATWRRARPGAGSGACAPRAAATSRRSTARSGGELAGGELDAGGVAGSAAVAGRRAVVLVETAGGATVTADRCRSGVGRVPRRAAARRLPRGAARRARRAAAPRAARRARAHRGARLRSAARARASRVRARVRGRRPGSRRDPRPRRHARPGVRRRPARRVARWRAAARAAPRRRRSCSWATTATRARSRSRPGATSWSRRAGSTGRPRRSAWSCADRSRAAAVAPFALRPLAPLAGTVTADLHVHGEASDDGQATNEDRLRRFVAEGVNVLVATDHDHVANYAPALARLGLADRVRVVHGSGGHGQRAERRRALDDRASQRVADPVPAARAPPRRAAEPEPRGRRALRRAAPRVRRARGAAQPPAADARRTSRRATSTSRSSSTSARAGRSIRCGRSTRPRTSRSCAAPAADGTRAIDFDAIEVMNGDSWPQYLATRADWYALLRQGVRRTGTANSDSHAPSELIAYPRNYVQGGRSASGDERRPAAFRRGAARGAQLRHHRAARARAARERRIARRPRRGRARPRARRVRGRRRGLGADRRGADPRERRSRARRSRCGPARSTSSSSATGSSRSRPARRSTPIPRRGSARIPGLYTEVIAPGFVSAAFTNPVFVDVDGNGRFDRAGAVMAGYARCAATRPTCPRTRASASRPSPCSPAPCRRR